ncbi:4Fe-4S binding protein [Clostridium estertheticum]|nr:4Fe-4S binding protein [Clostridium estertheticum]WAG65053.1 4Fe-4S binding protein [Clostridium estertheticum]
MKCIEASAPYRIHEENCLHCGNCYYSCPVKSVKKYN